MHILARFNKQKWNVKLYLENTKISSPKLSTVILLTTKLQKQFFFLNTGESKIGIKMFRLEEKLNLNEVKCSLKILMCNISRIHSIWTVTQKKNLTHLLKFSNKNGFRKLICIFSSFCVRSSIYFVSQRHFLLLTKSQSIDTSLRRACG